MSTVTSVNRAGRHLAWTRLLGVVGLVLMGSIGSLLVDQLPAAAEPTLQSSGSSFAALAIQQWVGQASTIYGLNINFQVSSSVLGLNAFGLNQDDFAASDIPYSSNQATNLPNQPYEYMPDVAGGLSFMYNLQGNDGNQISSLVLDAHVADEIFLGEIQYWNDSQIAALNPQLAGDLPHTKVVAVYRTDASGENYLLSDYMLHEDTANFTAAATAFQSFQPGSPNALWPAPPLNIVSSPTFKATYPAWSAGSLQGQNGSSNAADYVASSSSNGAITYVETAYAKQHGFPVASLVNASGAAVQPTSENVATALEDAILYPDLTQNLTGVYTNKLPNAYALSAYSYLVTPCSPSLAASLDQGSASCGGGPNEPSPFSATKGQELGQFVNYLACAGQDSMVDLGYSPLPPNLVQEDFWAIGRLNGGKEPPPVSSATCKNPYVDGQIVLPGEPTIIGESTTTIAGPPPGSPAAKAAASAAAAAAGTTGGAAGGVAGGATAGVSSGTSEGTAGSAGSTILTPAQLAQGDRLVDGQIVKTSPCEAVQRFLCAIRLDSAATRIGGVPLPESLGWVLALLAVFIALPLFGLVGWPMIKRRRQGSEDDTYGDGLTSPSLDGGGRS